MAEKQCDVCDKPAIWEAFFGPVMRKAEKYGFDKPYPENHTFRCKEHQYRPDARLGKLWLWKRLKEDN